MHPWVNDAVGTDFCALSDGHIVSNVGIISNRNILADGYEIADIHFFTQFRAPCNAATASVPAVFLVEVRYIFQQLREGRIRIRDTDQCRRHRCRGFEIIIYQQD